MYRAFARWYMSVRECIVTVRSRREAQEVYAGYHLRLCLL